MDQLRHNYCAPYHTHTHIHTYTHTHTHTHTHTIGSHSGVHDRHPTIDLSAEERSKLRVCVYRWVLSVNVCFKMCNGVYLGKWPRSQQISRKCYQETLWIKPLFFIHGNVWKGIFIIESSMSYDHMSYTDSCGNPYIICNFHHVCVCVCYMCMVMVN